MTNLLTNIFGAITGVAITAWIGGIFIAGNPADRMDRTCKPVIWTGNITASLTMLASGDPAWTRNVKSSFERADYGCKFSIWRLFYEDDFKLEKASEAVANARRNSVARRIEDATPVPATNR